MATVSAITNGAFGEYILFIFRWILLHLSIRYNTAYVYCVVQRHVIRYDMRLERRSSCTTSTSTHIYHQSVQFPFRFSRRIDIFQANRPILWLPIVCGVWWETHSERVQYFRFSVTSILVRKKGTGDRAEFCVPTFEFDRTVTASNDGTGSVPSVSEIYEYYLWSKYRFPHPLKFAVTSVIGVLLNRVF